jgi:methylmalonyl-CoA/ethylmalonyl-CoA epimerase
MKIDHIGFVVSDIDSALKRFSELYGLVQEGEIVFDPTQKVNLIMLSSKNNYKIELIQPIGKKSPSYDFMKRGGGFHHFCYSVQNIEKKIGEMKMNEHLLIKQPVPAILFDGRRVAFLFSKVDNQIVELVETI